MLTLDIQASYKPYFYPDVLVRQVLFILEPQQEKKRTLVFPYAEFRIYWNA